VKEAEAEFDAIQCHLIADDIFGMIKAHMCHNYYSPDVENVTRISPKAAKPAQPPTAVEPRFVCQRLPFLNIIACGRWGVPYRALDILNEKLADFGTAWDPISQSRYALEPIAAAQFAELEPFRKASPSMRSPRRLVPPTAIVPPPSSTATAAPSVTLLSSPAAPARASC
jgi:hypothetical protein